MAVVEVEVPDIGGFGDVPVIEIHIAAGDVVAVDDPLITLESDKATMDIPAPIAGTVSELRVELGDRVSHGSVIMLVEGEAPAGSAPKERIREDAAPAAVGPADYGSESGVYDEIEVTVPDIGDFHDIPVIEVHVARGDTVVAEDPLITLESDKATMDVPAPAAGRVAEVSVAVGDIVSEGTRILRLTSIGQDGETSPATATPAATATHPAASTARPPSPQRSDLHAEVLVLGAGPGGYTAAFRAADLGKQVVLVDRWPALGGVCLNVGCIPSKALLHAARVIAETKEMSDRGLSFASPVIDIDKLRDWKDAVVSRLTGGLAGLARQRKVTILRGTGRFVTPNQVQVTADDGGVTIVSFDHAIIAAGSEPIRLPFVPHDDPRVIDSTGALAVERVPQRLLILGGGIIGLEMATVYHELGSRVTVVELMDQLIPGADKDIVSPLFKRVAKRYEAVHLKTKVTALEARPEGLVVTFDGAAAPPTDTFDAVLESVGRRPNGSAIGAANAGVVVDERGFIPVDKQQHTNVPHIFAIGDIVGPPMLAHKATHEGKVAAEVAAGQRSYFDAKAIPSVAYTDPEIAWVGLTETEAKSAGIGYGKGVFPWAASGRSLTLGREDGLTKLIFDEATHRLLGAGIVGSNAGDLISEAAHAIEMGSDATDIGLTVHPHPTLSETVGMAAEAFDGTITDLYQPKRK